MRERLLQGFSLGPLHIEPVTGTVRGDGPPRHLPSRAVELLLQLAHQPGELLSREELLARVWGDGQGSAEALSHAISELRQGLGDHASNPSYIQTVPRRGYRLLVEPRLDDERGESEPVHVLPLYRELMKRGVVQAAAAYLVVGWLLIQVAGEVFSDLPLPAWAARAVTYTVIAGFPIVVALAWFLEFAEGRIAVDRGNSEYPGGGGLERNYLAIVAAFTIAAAGVGIYQVTIGIPVPQPPATAAIGDPEQDLPVEPNSLAVLRFRAVGSEPRASLLSDGLAEDVLVRLSQVPGLAVASRTDAWSLDAGADSAEVRRRLRVARFLHGTVRLDGNDLRVTVELIDSGSGFQEFSRSFERRLEDFAEVQREITSLTVANLRVALEPDIEEFLDAMPTQPDLDAYVLYRMGRDIMHMPLTGDSIASAIDYFRRSIDIDPAYAAAHAGLCAAFVRRFELSSRAEEIDAAEQSCATALISNPNLYMVLTAMGDLYRLTNRLHLAERAYRNAVDINPRDVAALTGLARVFERQNRLDEAETQLQRAMRAQPGNWRAIDATGGFYFATGEFAKAADAYRKVVFLDPDNWQAGANLGAALLMSGSFSGAADALQHSLAIQPDHGSYSNLAVIRYYLGEFDEAVTIYERALELAPRSITTWLNLGDALNFAGTETAARRAYQRAADLAGERLAVNAGDVESIETLAWASAMLGDADRARELIDRAIALAPNDPYAWYYDALIRHESGDVAGALDAIERAMEIGYPSALLKAEPILADLRGRQRFAAILARNFEEE